MSVNYEQVKEFRLKLFNEIDVNSDLYYKEDIKRLQNDSWYCQRFINHQRKSVEKGVKMAKEELEWRKKFAVREITEETLPKKLFDQDCVYICGKDKSGRKLLSLEVKNILKPEAGEELDNERFMVYWVEKVENMNNGPGISVLIDCTDAGLKNVNTDIIKFSKYLFTYHYPKILGHFLVYNMPWLFSAIWSLVKSWLPRYVVDMIKFVDKDTIQEYADKNNLPLHMGGTVSKSSM